MSAASIALWRLGLDWHDVAQMQLDMRAAIKRSNNDLIHSFRQTGSTAGFRHRR